MLDKKTLSERDICSKYIPSAVQAVGWDRYTQTLEEVSFTNGNIYVRGKVSDRVQLPLITANKTCG
jgi:type I restriction enzyme, R subunit